jgi:FkbM family methyltransferase
MKNVFLDLGTHYGQGLREFIEKYKMNNLWRIHTFEANPVTYDVFTKQYHQQTPWVIPHQKAVGYYNGTITVNMETPPGEGATGMGSSVIPLEEWDPWGGKNHEPFKSTAEVPCIDFAEFIQKNFSKEDFIVIKMDIEGSEYETLKRLITTDVIDYIDDLYVEWHNRCFPDPSAMIELESKLIGEIENRGVKLESWR